MSCENEHFLTNETLSRIVPELASQYAKYPMKRNSWLDPSSTTFEGFIPYVKDKNVITITLKVDYVWGPGTRGFGYYHLLTRDSYVILNARLKNNAPAQCSVCCGSNARKRYNDHTDVENIVYARSIASRPDDFLGQQEVIQIARGQAKAAYHQDQNFQLLFMLAT
mmetsp:Transcript_8504/g.10754  ORF Transcript_8504/g.10754 Transcript_8504/m.10754 type:complete len:166 (-) Transcript_8504:187-684(-)